jgi:hypothetical protein
MRLFVLLHFQSLKAIENADASVRRGNSQLIRLSLPDEIAPILQHPPQESLMMTIDHHCLVAPMSD